MSEHRLQSLLEPRAIALVGASPKTETFGWTSYRALVDAGYDGEIFLVNPRYDKIDGRRCVASLLDVPGIDHAILNVSNARLEALLDQAIEAGVGAVTIFASGYLEGDRAPLLLERMRRKAADAGLHVCGGNGTGFWNRDYKVQCSLIGRPLEAAGSTALIVQSGSVYGAMLQTDGRLSFNLSVSTGQEIATTTADYLDYAIELPTTRAVGLFMETIRDPAGFLSAARKANERGIRIVALKVARTVDSARMAVSHSGALAGNDDAYNAVFERVNVTRVHDFDELIATLQLACQPRVMASGGLVAITDSGGEREHLTDLAEDAGVLFAEISPATRTRLGGRLEYGLEATNPLDAWGTGNDYAPIFEDCFSALIDDDNAAAGLWVADTRDDEPFREPFLDAGHKIAVSSGKPVVFATCVASAVVHQTATRLREQGTPLIDGLGPAVKALSHAMVWRDQGSREHDPPSAPNDDMVAEWRSRLSGGVPVDEETGLALLRDFGVGTVSAVAVESVSQAVSAGARLGFPVALKTAMPGIAHKSDVGGVVLNLDTEDNVRSAYERLEQALGSRCLIESMAPRGIEMVFGFSTDAQFGTLLLVGVGGVLVEIQNDVVYAIPPFGPSEARRMIDRLRNRRLLDGIRGQPGADVDLLAEALANFSVLASSLGDLIVEFDVNPVIAAPTVILAADALVVTRNR